MDRLAVAVDLKPGSEERAAVLVAAGPPFDLEASDLVRHEVFLSPRHAILVFEGSAVDRHLEELANDPVLSAAFSAWGPLIEGTPRLARLAFSWERAPGPANPAEKPQPE